mgnify:CR=1 FL=1|tara:strand:- start:402 stop:653 length:252 start_codon:yes stop_codon:yes gene_type:complete
MIICDQDAIFIRFSISKVRFVLISEMFYNNCVYGFETIFAFFIVSENFRIKVTEKKLKPLKEEICAQLSHYAKGNALVPNSFR